MKVKTLLAPLLIVATIFLLIWLVYPAYTNGTNGFLEQRAKLADEKNKLSDVQGKSSNIDRLYTQFQSDSASRGVIFSYVPDVSKEEEIIDSLNSIASSSGVLPVNIAIQEKKMPVASNDASAPVSDGSTAPGAAASNPPVATPIAVAPATITVNYSVAGNYGQIKSLFGNLYRLGRFNEVSTLEISKLSQNGTENAGGNADNLEASMVLVFNFLKSPMSIDSNNPVFSTSSFNMKIADDIKNRNNVGITVPAVDQAGKVNPFLP